VTCLKNSIGSVNLSLLGSWVRPLLFIGLGHKSSRVRVELSLDSESNICCFGFGTNRYRSRMQGQAKKRTEIINSENSKGSTEYITVFRGKDQPVNLQIEGNSSSKDLIKSIYMLLFFEAILSLRLIYSSSKDH
jgi:hypothetical protein